MSVLADPRYMVWPSSSTVAPTWEKVAHKKAHEKEKRMKHLSAVLLCEPLTIVGQGIGDPGLQPTFFPLCLQ